MSRVYNSTSVLDAALGRMVSLYSNPKYKVVVACSGGKDSTVCVELAIMAARQCGKLPINVQFVDEEILVPGTHAYLYRMAQRKSEINFVWAIAHQPNINPFNREDPYWYCFDTRLRPEQWVSVPPSFATIITENDLYNAINTDVFPVDFGQELVAVIGMRVQESVKRAMGLASIAKYGEGEFLSGPPERGSNSARTAWPIYDWKYGDVWKFIKEMQVDYNESYDIMLKMGVPHSAMRIGPTVFNEASIKSLGWVSRAYNKWFDKVCLRLPGIRTAAKFGLKAVQPMLRINETWKECYKRTCVDEAPKWIAERAVQVARNKVRQHSRHSTTPFPEVFKCKECGLMGSWKELANKMYNGDPFSFSCGLDYMPPGYFRPGYGAYGKKERKKEAKGGAS